MPVSVAAVILRGGKVLVAKRVFGGPLGGLWEFPGGKLEEGETESEALVREFDEEFGARIVPLRALGSAVFMNRGKDRRLVAWLAELPEEEKLELREHQCCKWISIDDLEEIDIADSDRLLFPYLAELR
jgi:8-oxo-dGTP diphosphatase